MSNGASPGGGQETALYDLFRAIVMHDRPLVSRLLADSPALVRLAVTVGATREAAEAYFFSEISHYAYAGDTALHIAAAAYELPIAEELMSAGANISARNRRGAQPIHYAVDGSPESARWNPDGQYAVVAFLIAAGADPNAQDKSGVAPLHRAVRTRCTGAVRALLDHGADAIRRNKSGSTPLHLAVQNTGRGGTGAAASQGEQAKVIRLLLDHGARPSDKDTSGKSVLACVKAEWIEALLRGA